MTTDLRECRCGGEVMHLIRDYDESIIKCQKCKEVTDIETLWNTRPPSQPSAVDDSVLIPIISKALDIGRGLQWSGMNYWQEQPIIDALRPYLSQPVTEAKGQADELPQSIKAEEGSALYDLQALCYMLKDGLAIGVSLGRGDDFVVKHWKEIHAALSAPKRESVRSHLSQPVTEAKQQPDDSPFLQRSERHTEILRGLMKSGITDAEITAAIDWAFSQVCPDAEKFSSLMILAEAAARYMSERSTKREIEQSVEITPMSKAL